MVNAVIYYFKHVLKRNELVVEIQRPQREGRLPKVLSKEDIEKIINATVNLKHKVILSLLYAAGLRVGELLNLKISNIDGKRKVLLVEQGKGPKTEERCFPKNSSPCLGNTTKPTNPKNIYWRGSMAKNTVPDLSGKFWEQLVKRQG